MRVFLALIAIACVPACSRPDAARTADTGKLDSRFRTAVETHAVPGVVAIVADKNAILYHAAFGKQDVAKGVPMRTDTIVRLASMTKPVTSVAVMMLVEDGRFKLDDPVSRYLPIMRNKRVLVDIKPDGTYITEPAKSEVTIRQLLSNTSGFAYAFSNHTMRRLQDATHKEPADLPLIYQPGSRWTYSMSTLVLGYLVEAVSDKPLPAFLEERIFNPLGMQETAWDVPLAKHSRVATYHQRENGMLKELPNPESLTMKVRGDGDLYSTSSDYIKFLQMFLNGGMGPKGRLLKEETIREMTSNQIGDLIVETQPGTDPLRSKSFPIGAGRDKFGLGFQIATSNAENPNFRYPGSYSWSGIYNTHFWVDPVRGLAGVILMQVLPFYEDDCIALLQDFEQLTNRTFRP